MMAYQDGLGEIREQRIQLIGASLEEIQMDWRPAVHIEEWGVLPSVHASVKGASSVRHTRISNYLSPLLCPTALACILKWIYGRRMRPADLEKLERLSSDS
jgi:hypothetical protein